MPAPLPRISHAVIYNGKFAVESETSNGTTGDAARVCIIPNQFYFKLDVSFTILINCSKNFSNCEHYSELTKVTKHKLTGSKTSTCML